VAPLRLSIVRAHAAQLLEELPASVPHGARVLVLRDDAGLDSNGRGDRRVQVHFVARTDGGSQAQAALRLPHVLPGHGEGTWVEDVVVETRDLRVRRAGVVVEAQEPGAR
jgi:hypothetical protein